VQQSIYIRVKRANQTIFLYAEPSDSVGDVKGKIAAINKVYTTYKILFILI
jgi:hypothetical protein